MAEGFILPEANQILLLIADGLPKCVILNAEDCRLISFHRSIHYHFFFVNVCLSSKSKDLHLKQKAAVAVHKCAGRSEFLLSS